MTIYAIIFEDNVGRCRWSTNPSESLLFVKSNHNRLNILDAEKKVMMLQKPVPLEKNGCNHG